MEKNVQQDRLNPEKVYFVEKFGSLINNINESYSRPVQEALIERIGQAIEQYRLDLPEIVKTLEVKRLEIARKTYKKPIPVRKPIVKDNITQNTVTEIAKEPIIPPIKRLINAPRRRPVLIQDIEEVIQSVSQPVLVKKQTTEDIPSAIHKIPEVVRKATEEPPQNGVLTPAKALRDWEQRWDRYSKDTLE